MFLKFIVVLHYKQLTIGTPAYIYNFFDFLFNVNNLFILKNHVATPFCIVSDLLNVRAWCVCNLYFTWRRFRSYVYFEEHISVINYIYKVFSSGIEYDVLIFCCTNNTS